MIKKSLVTLSLAIAASFFSNLEASCHPCDNFYAGVGVNENGLFQDTVVLDNFAYATKTAYGGHVYFGYEFNPCVALEIDWTYFGRTNSTSDVLIHGVLFENLVVHDITWVLPLRAKLTLPVTCNFGLFLMVGGHYFNQRLYPQGVDPDFKLRNYGLGVNVGVGLQYLINHAIGLRFDINRYYLNNNLEIYQNIWGASVFYQF